MIKYHEEMSFFAKSITDQKYAKVKSDGQTELWRDISNRVSLNVLKSVGASKSLISEVAEIIYLRKFIPGGRYLYAAGMPYHQVQNCFASETRVVTRDGVRTIKDLAILTDSGSIPILMTTDGKWVAAPVLSFGKQTLMKIIVKRSGVEKELYATPEHSWRIAKNENKSTGRSIGKIEVLSKDLKPGQRLWSVYGYGISRTPVSPVGIQHGIVFGDGNVPKDDFGFNMANVRLCGEKDRELLKYFNYYPCRPVDDDIEVSNLPRHFKSFPSLSWDRSYLLGWLSGYFAADGCVSEDGVVKLASTKKENLEFVKNVAYLLGIGIGTITSQERISNLTNDISILYSVTFMRQHLTSEFFLISKHKERFMENFSQKCENMWTVVSLEETDRIEEVYCANVADTHEFVLEDNILTGNCFLLRADDSREGWSELLHKSSMSLMTGGGIGTVYSDIRAEGKLIRKTGGTATGPVALMQMVNECGRHIMQGGSRRSAIWAGLHWNHQDIFKFIHIKDWSSEIKTLKEKDFNFPAPLDGTNISVILDDLFFKAFQDEKHILHSHAQSVYWETVLQMLKTAEPGFSIDVGENAGENLRNACTESTSRDDSDTCNLGSINMARIESLSEMERIVELGTLFLLAGTVYSDIPYAKVDTIRTKNRRIGLGLMGLHEWLLMHGKKYGPDSDLEKYLKIYANNKAIAHKYSSQWDLSESIKTRAIAPVGTIGIIGETTTAIEPIFCVALKRRYLKHTVWHYQYIIDPTAKRLIDLGVNPEAIEDAYTLAENVERRIEFQAWMQQFVDQGISSTINLPAWGSEHNNENTVKKFGNTLMKYLPKLRGVTCYPDGSRGGQPLVPVRYTTAIKHLGEVFVEATDICDITKSGTCGS